MLVLPVFNFGGSGVSQAYRGAPANILNGGATNSFPELKWYLTGSNNPVSGVTTWDNALDYPRPYQFSLVNFAEVSEPAFIGSFMNSGVKTKTITSAKYCGGIPANSPFIIVELLDAIVDVLFDQGAMSGTDGTTTTFLSKKKLDLVTYNLPRPMGGAIVNFAEVLYVPAQTVLYTNTSSTVDANTTAQCIGQGPGVNDKWYMLQTQLKVDRVGSCAQLDQHQVARCVAFGMFAYPDTGGVAEARMAYMPYVINVKGSDNVFSLISASSSDTFREDYEAERERGQDVGYAIRGALANSYTNLVARARFRDLPPEKFIQLVAFVVEHFKAGPYYFQVGKTYAESGSWDWLESAIKWLAPVADVIAAPFGMSGVTHSISSGLLSLFNDGDPSDQSAAMTARKQSQAKGKKLKGTQKKKKRLHTKNGRNSNKVPKAKMAKAPAAPPASIRSRLGP